MKPYARAWKYARLYRQAKRHANRAIESERLMPLAFVLACGRSGTTVLGRILGRHPQVQYLFEPYHSWAAIDPRTDMLQLYVNSDAHCILDSADANDAIRSRFNRVIRTRHVARQVDLVIEKTPINAMRIGYLLALAPDARFIHIVRDGVDVARSIARLSGAGDYRIFGKPRLGKWWGIGGCKWRFLAQDGIVRGYYPAAVESISDDFSKGAYEWLVSLHEVDRFRQQLGARLFEFTYQELTDSPTETLRAVCAHIDVHADAEWLAGAAHMLDEARTNPGLIESLPGPMAEGFNRLQERYGFDNRVEARLPA
jgi:hypothetical protein